MAKNGIFDNFDDEEVYNASQRRALDELTRNFVVEFGKSKAQIAFDWGTGDITKLFGSERNEETPVRWMYAFVAISFTPLLMHHAQQQHLGTEPPGRGHRAHWKAL